MYVDVGIYGAPGPVLRKEHWTAKEAVAKMEKFLRSIRGYQANYADCYMSRDEYWQMFDRTHYDQIRKKNIMLKTLLWMFMIKLEDKDNHENI